MSAASRPGARRKLDRTLTEPRRVASGHEAFTSLVADAASGEVSVLRADGATP
jgi:hypothetical protein